MDRIEVGPGAAVDAAFTGRQLFTGGGPGTIVRLNGNPADYRLEQAGEGWALIARNGSGEYHLGAGIERVGFVSGAFSLTRNLPAVIAAGSRDAQRAGSRPFTSHAQIREDVLLMRALRDVDPRRGFYVDVGAYDPDVDSVTRVFYDRGWRGINIEPLAAQFAKLEQRRPRDLNLHAAASHTAGRLRFYANDGEQLGTLEPRFAEAGSAASAVEVPVVRLADVLRDHAPADIHFLKVDVEGHERSVLEGCDFAIHRPWIVMVEAVAPNRADVATFGEWEDVLLDAGYRLAGEDELNRYYLAEERAALASCFALPVDHYQPGALLAERDRLAAEVAALRREIGERAAASDVTPRGGLARVWRRIGGGPGRS